MVEKLSTEHAATVQWLPYLLRPDMPEQGQAVPAAVRVKAGQVGSRLKQLAQAAGLPMVTPEWMSNPRLAHEATEYAREQGKANEFHRVVFRLYYGEGRDIGSWSVLVDAAREAGLDPDSLQREVQTGRFTPLVDQYIAEAHELGINSVPTYILNDRYAIVGAQPYAVFQQAVLRLSAESPDRSALKDV